MLNFEYRDFTNTHNPEKVVFVLINSLMALQERQISRFMTHRRLSALMHLNILILKGLSNWWFISNAKNNNNNTNTVKRILIFFSTYCWSTNNPARTSGSFHLTEKQNGQETNNVIEV